MGEGDTCTLGGLWEEKLVSHLPSLWQAPSDTISSFQLHNSTHPPQVGKGLRNWTCPSREHVCPESVSIAKVKSVVHPPTHSFDTLAPT